LGTLRLYLVGFDFLVPGWLLMALCVGGILISLRRPRLSAAIGAAGCALLLGASSVVGVVGFLTIETRQFSLFLSLQTVAFVLALLLLVMHVRRRRRMADDVIK
jgi:TRAP-type mannitol/chloroaromatic compound transport system permease large subunit